MLREQGINAQQTLLKAVAKDVVRPAVLADMAFKPNRLTIAPNKNRRLTTALNAQLLERGVNRDALTINPHEGTVTQDRQTGTMALVDADPVAKTDQLSFGGRHRVPSDRVCSVDLFGSWEQVFQIRKILVQEVIFPVHRTKVTCYKHVTPSEAVPAASCELKLARSAVSAAQPQQPSKPEHCRTL